VTACAEERRCGVLPRYKQVDLAPGEIVESVRFPLTGHVVASTSRRSRSGATRHRERQLAAWLRLDDGSISEAFLSAGGVAPIPMRLSSTEDFLTGKLVTPSLPAAPRHRPLRGGPITDVRGSADYKRLLLGQLVLAHLYVLCRLDARELLEAAG